MKIAGRKNDGAWFRTNQFIKSLDSGPKAALATQIEGLASAADAFTALTDLQGKCGVMSSWVPTTLAAWCTAMVTHGIPRQVWFGVLSFDTYTKGEDGKFTPDHATPFRLFAIDVRWLLKRYSHGYAAIDDLTNGTDRDQGNPSGYPDATFEPASSDSLSKTRPIPAQVALLAARKGLVGAVGRGKRTSGS